jgi:hypothetical protein
MLQFYLPEAFWEDSRRTATFIYNRVPPVCLTPGEETIPYLADDGPYQTTTVWSQMLGVTEKAHT